MPTQPPRFLIAAGAAIDAVIELDAAEARHARVRRLRVGEAVGLFDGRGESWRGRVERFARESVAIRIDERLEPNAGESTLRLTLAVAALKADRFDWLVEKATEIGVTAILPFTSRYSLARPSGARLARWRQIAVSAAKQSGRSVVTTIGETASWEETLTAAPPERLLLWEGERQQHLAGFRERAPQLERVTAIVGPEGGFSPEEIEAAVAAGCHSIGLGPRILRAETAAIAAVALCQHLWGDLGGTSAAGP